MTCTQYYVAGSIDGYIADADNKLDWLFQFNGTAGLGEHYESFFAGVGALAMGASTYEFILAEEHDHWPYEGRTTWVFTHRDLPRFEGADIVFTHDEVAVVHTEMVASAGERNVWLVGGGDLVAQFAERGLLDEIVLAVAPVTLGGGAPLLPARVDAPMRLDQVETVGDFAMLHYTVRP